MDSGEPTMRSTILQLPDGQTIRVWLAATRRERMRGLLGRDGLPRGECLLLDPCGAIHTIGMRFALDLVFLDADGRVVGVRRDVRPGRMAWGGWRARTTLEAAAGWLDLEALTQALESPAMRAAVRARSACRGV